MNGQDLFDAISAGLVEVGLSPREATEVTEAVIRIADVAAQSALVTIEVNMPDFGINNRPAQHITMQVLAARINSMVLTLEAELKAEGAKSHEIPVEVPDNG